MSNIIRLSDYVEPPNPGNGARDTLIRLMQSAPQLFIDDADNWSDWLLGSLWVNGFKIVPLEPTDEQ